MKSRLLHNPLPRIGTLREQRPAWAHYLVGRRRRRAAAHVEPPGPIASPADIAGLKLWLHGGTGTRAVWNAAPASGSAWLDYSPSSSDYNALGHTHWLRVYAFKTVEGERVYSAGFREIEVTDDGSMLFYYINWSWDAVAGAEGYRLLRNDPVNGWNFDGFVDVVGTSFLDLGFASWAAGSTVTPTLLAECAPGDAVGRWLDQSGEGNDAVALMPEQSPALFASVVNGRPVLRFDDADDGMATPLVLGASATVFVVYACYSDTLTARRAVQGSNNWLIGPYALKHDFYHGYNFTGGPDLVPAQFVAQAAWQNGSVARNIVNGAAAGAEGAPAFAPGALGVGTAGAFGEALAGDIAEVIAFDTALSDTDMARLWDWLSARYELF